MQTTYIYDERRVVANAYQYKRILNECFSNSMQLLHLVMLNSKPCKLECDSKKIFVEKQHSMLPNE